jgi:hypothetical protein
VNKELEKRSDLILLKAIQEGQQL